MDVPQWGPVAKQCVCLGNEVPQELQHLNMCIVAAYVCVCLPDF